MKSSRIVALLLVCLAAPAQSVVPEIVRDLPTRGETLRFLHLAPASPTANVIVLPGSNGVLELRPDGTAARELLEGGGPSRYRQKFAEQGFAVAVLDVPTDMQVSGLSIYRQSTDYLADIAEVIRYLRRQADVPVWLVGHDFGAESAVYAAQRLPAEQPVGIALMAGRAFNTPLVNMHLRELARPVVMFSHPADSCTTISEQVRTFDEFLAAPVREHVVLSGGDRNGDSCSSGYHMFDGLGDQLAAKTADFIRANNALVAAPVSEATVVEYYHTGFDHYFVTWVPEEIALLDAGTTIAGWVRTGATLRVWRTAQPGTSPVCRFYIPPGLGDSHFYGRGKAECDATAAKNPSFVLEDAQFMHVLLPADGACPAGTAPVYRVFSNRADANHRYTSDRALRGAMVASGWLAEGDGPDLVVMCGPA